ncbi:hypothetical protein [[Phormidium] sp. ETS-05]|uniref:hypothetical protein n=1 Tax=[Phormidium] sp. ETS-05 TaxID=222819 RepID=UPI0018EEFF66|nr:hypothetical protein [[Phormidium] sp. ETS-05]
MTVVAQLHTALCQTIWYYQSPSPYRRCGVWGEGTVSDRLANRYKYRAVMINLNDAVPVPSDKGQGTSDKGQMTNHHYIT